MLDQSAERSQTRAIVAGQPGLKRIFWTDDSDDGGHSVRAGLMPCGPLK
jgi:hypothetical protein